MNRPLTSDGFDAASRAASVNSSAARWPLDILDVSINCAGSSADALVRRSTGGDLVSIITTSRIDFFPPGRHRAQQPARLKIFRARFDEPFHFTDDPGN